MKSLSRNPLTKNLQLLPRRWRGFMPIRALSEMESEMERMFKSPVGWLDDLQDDEFMPSCNIEESENEYIIKLDVPGVKKENVKIKLENNRLTVSGERKDEREEEDKDKKRFLSESYYGYFTRSFTLPGEVDENNVRAHCEDGVLEICIPKEASTKAVDIKVQ